MFHSNSLLTNYSVTAIKIAQNITPVVSLVTVRGRNNVAVLFASEKNNIDTVFSDVIQDLCNLASSVRAYIHSV